MVDTKVLKDLFVEVLLRKEIKQAERQSQETELRNTNIIQN